MGRKIESHKDLSVFQRAVAVATEIFERTSHFPREERYSLTDQIRRSSRSVCANIGEAWRKRRYRAAFISKLCDAEAEASETQVWIEIAHRCGYLADDEASRLDGESDHLLGQLVRMIREPQSWIIGE
jgi:four helix bundle protein